MRRWIALALIALLIFSISQNPNQAADTASSLGATIADMGRGFSTFLHNVAT